MGSGKSTFLKTLIQIAGKLKWTVSSISSDALRKEMVDKYREKNTEIEEREAFDKTAKTAGAEFQRRLEKLVSGVNKAGHAPVHIIFIGKNHPVNAIDRTVKTVREKLPEGCKVKCLYLIPKIQ